VSLNLDPTASNKMLWPNNKNPPGLIFTDRNKETQTPPTLFCDYTALPFRDNIFETVFYDPPHAARNKISRSYQHQNPAAWSYYGWDITPKQLREGIRGASKEFLRVAKRVCLKWSEVDYGEAWILGMMREWKPVYKKILKYSRIEKIPSYWITMVKKTIEDEKLYSIEKGESDWGLLRPVQLVKIGISNNKRDNDELVEDASREKHPILRATDRDGSDDGADGVTAEGNPKHVSKPRSKPKRSNATARTTTLDI